MGPVVTATAIGYGARMGEPVPQLPSRFALATADADLDWRQPPAGEFALRGARLLHWGPAAEVAHGKAVGVFDGVLFNANELRHRLGQRGLAVVDLDQGHLALEWLATFGPSAVGDLRWHGSLALLHRAQGAVLLARDLVGVGWLGRASLANGAVWTSDPRPAEASQRAAPPGWIGVWSAAGMQQPKVNYAPANRLYLREIPNEARIATATTALAQARSLIAEAVAAHVDAVGGVDAHAISHLRLVDAQRWANGNGVWTGAGLAGWLAARVQSRERAPDLRDDGPHEPVAAADPTDVAERTWRWRTLPDGPLRAARIAALDAGRPLAAPHLDPALLAWLGALPRAVRPAWLDRGEGGSTADCTPSGG